MNIMNFMNKLISAILLVLLIWMGALYYFKSNEAIDLKKKLSIAQLAENEKIRIVYKEKEKKIYIIKRVGSSEITTTDAIDINNSDNTISVDNNDTIIIKHKSLITFPLSLNVSGHFSTDSKLVGGVRIAQIEKFGMGVNAGVNDLSISVERDIYDVFPMFQNSFIGIFYNFIDQNNRVGLRTGVKL